MLDRHEPPERPARGHGQDGEHHSDAAVRADRQGVGLVDLRSQRRGLDLEPLPVGLDRLPLRTQVRELGLERLGSLRERLVLASHVDILTPGTPRGISPVLTRRAAPGYERLPSEGCPTFTCDAAE